MKKYLGLFVVVVMALTMNTHGARAEDSGGRGNDDDAQAKAMCANGGFAALTDAAGKVFISEQACVNFFGNDDNKGQGDNSGRGDDDNKAQRSAFRQRFEDLKDKIKDEKDAAKARIKLSRINLRENALARFDAVVLRIGNLETRVNALIVKLEAKGVDVAGAKSFVVTADAKLSAAQVKITEINALLSVSINELSAADKIKLRTLANDTQTLIKDAHQALKDAIKSLKDAARVKMDAEAGTDGGDN